MKIDEIKFRLTTTGKLICNKCKGPIEGKEGYMKISLSRERIVFQADKNLFIKICNKCFEETIKEYFKGRKTRDKKWKRLLKARILTGLR